MEPAETAVDQLHTMKEALMVDKIVSYSLYLQNTIEWKAYKENHLQPHLFVNSYTSVRTI